MKKKFKLANKNIGQSEPVYFIADIAANHDGKLSQALDLITAAKDAGADAAKFQHFNANSIVSDIGFKNLGSKFSHQKNWKKSIFETYQDASIDLKWTDQLKNRCDKVGIEFCSTPYAFDLTDHLDKYVNFYKIGSGDITWIDMLEYVSRKGKPVILSTGASDISEVETAVKAIQKYNNEIVLMQCNTNYTANDEDNFNYINLNVLKKYQEKFPNTVLGLSDHTTGEETVLGSVVLGARVIEKHFTLNNDLIGPDHKFSMNPKSWENMVKKTRSIEKSLGDGFKKVEKNERETVILQRRAIRAKTKIVKGDKISHENTESLRPCPEEAIDPSKIKEIIGKKSKNNISIGETIKWEDLE